MSIRKVQYRNYQEFEYTTPNGELYWLTFVEEGDNKQLKIRPDGIEEDDPKCVVYDVFMIIDIVDALREMGVDLKSRPKRSGLPTPDINDHRHEDPAAVIKTSSDLIQKEVDEHMQNMDVESDEKRPIESFSTYGQIKQSENESEENTDNTESEESNSTDAPEAPVDLEEML